MNTTIIKMALIVIAAASVAKAIQDANYIPLASTITPSALAAVVQYGRGDKSNEDKDDSEDREDNQDKR